jgi:hypothetical protein
MTSPPEKIKSPEVQAQGNYRAKKTDVEPNSNLIIHPPDVVSTQTCDHNILGLPRPSDTTNLAPRRIPCLPLLVLYETEDIKTIKRRFAQDPPAAPDLPGEIFSQLSSVRKL